MVPSRLGITIKTDKEQIKQVRIVPQKQHYVVELVYEQAVANNNLDSQLIAGVDLGIDNLMTVTSDQVGFVPIAVSRSASETTAGR